MFHPSTTGERASTSDASHLPFKVPPVAFCTACGTVGTCLATRPRKSVPTPRGSDSLRETVSIGIVRPALVSRGACATRESIAAVVTIGPGERRPSDDNAAPPDTATHQRRSVRAGFILLSRRVWRAPARRRIRAARVEKQNLGKAAVTRGPRRARGTPKKVAVRRGFLRSARAPRRKTPSGSALLRAPLRPRRPRKPLEIQGLVLTIDAGSVKVR